MKNDLLYILLQYGQTPLDSAKGDEVVQALKKQQMKVHSTNNNDCIVYDSFDKFIFLLY